MPCPVCIAARFRRRARKKCLPIPGRSTPTPFVQVDGARAADGGVKVTGRWALVSGCELAEWVMLSCVLVDADGEPCWLAPDVPETRLAFVNRAELDIIDTWHVGGMRGTGSHDVQVRNVFVPEHRTLALTDPSQWDSALGRIPSLSSMASGLAAQFIGVANKTLKTIYELSRTKSSPAAALSMRDNVQTQMTVALQSTTLEAARATIHRAVGQVWDKAAAAESVSLADITEVWAATLHGEQVAWTAVDELYTTAGTSAIYATNPLERCHRDIRVMRQHLVAQPTWLEQIGRCRLGLEPTIPVYSV